MISATLTKEFIIISGGKLLISTSFPAAAGASTSRTQEAKWKEGSRQGCKQRLRQGCTQRDPDKDVHRSSLLTHSMSLLPVCLWALKGRRNFLYLHASIFLGFSLRAYFREKWWGMLYTFRHTSEKLWVLSSPPPWSKYQKKLSHMNF